MPKELLQLVTKLEGRTSNLLGSHGKDPQELGRNDVAISIDYDNQQKNLHIQQ